MKKGIIPTQFITDAKGKKSAVILSMSKYQQLLEDIQDLAGMVKRSNESTRSLDQVKAKLKKDSLL